MIRLVVACGLVGFVLLFGLLLFWLRLWVGLVVFWLGLDACRFLFVLVPGDCLLVVDLRT